MGTKGILRTADELVGFWCPGCGEIHYINVVPNCRPCWGFDGNYDAPTFSPSILVRGTRHLTEDEYQRVRAGEKLNLPERVCHSFVKAGQIQFLGDCTHALAGQTVALTLPEAVS